MSINEGYWGFKCKVLISYVNTGEIASVYNVKMIAYQSLSISYGLTLLLVLFAAGLLLRVFIIFHDCCHRAFFANRMMNEIVGTLFGILT
jgi:fatty acid desaturase